MDIAAAAAADEALLLDLLNTTPVIDGAQRDQLAGNAEARSWMRDHDIPPTDAERQALIDVRSILQAVVRGERSPVALQPFLKTVSARPKATDAGLDWRLQLDKAAVRAVLAWDALRIAGPGRLRACANPECRLFLIDRSKPNSARWCSMAVCGNRMKARRHYRRIRAGGIR